MLLIVVEILAYFLEYNAAAHRQLNMSDGRVQVRVSAQAEVEVAYLMVGKSMRFRVVSWKPAVRHVSRLYSDLGPNLLTLRIQGSLNRACNASR